MFKKLYAMLLYLPLWLFLFFYCRCFRISILTIEELSTVMFDPVMPNYIIAGGISGRYMYFVKDDCSIVKILIPHFVGPCVGGVDFKYFNLLNIKVIDYGLSVGFGEDEYEMASDWILNNFDKQLKEK